MKYSSDTWTVEPYGNTMLDLWSIGKGGDFVWLLLATDPSSDRHRSIPREEGLTEIQARRGRHILAGRVQHVKSKRHKRSTLVSGEQATPVSGS